MSLKKTTDGTLYFNLLNQIDGKISSFEELSTKKKGRFIYLRHDVDSETMDPAIQLAKAESQRNIISTYYLRYVSNYFQFNNKFLNEVKFISSLGHRIGLHNNVFPEYLQTQKPIIEIISKPLNFLRDNGVVVNCCCEHGDPELLKQGLNNIMIWKNWEQDAVLGPEKRKDIIPQNYKITLNDINMKYNACYIDRDAFLGDGGGGWTGIWGRFSKKQRYFKKLPDIRRNIIQRFNDLPSGVFVALFHPHWWNQ
jgi:hypothetical protein